MFNTKDNKEQQDYLKDPFDDDFDANNDIALTPEQVIESKLTEQFKDITISLFMNNMPLLFSFYKKFGTNLNKDQATRLKKYVDIKSKIELKRFELNNEVEAMQYEIRKLQSEINNINTNIDDKVKFFETQKENILKGFDDLVELDLLSTEVINIDPKAKKL